MFIGFANFYQRFIQIFSKIVASLTLMLKTLPSDINGTVSDWKQNYSDEKISKIIKFKSIKLSFGSEFLTLEAKIAFIWLKPVFTKAPILQHFDSKCHIRIKTDAFKYVIGNILRQLTLKIGQ